MKVEKIASWRTLIFWLGLIVWLVIGGRLGIRLCGSEAIQRMHICNQTANQDPSCSEPSLKTEWESQTETCRAFQNIGWPVVWVYLAFYLGAKIVLGRRKSSQLIH
jgi:hypothetical protein